MNGIARLLLVATLFVAPVAVIAQSRPATPPSTQPAASYVLMNTTKGKIVIELDAAKAPKSVENFLSYVDKKSYDGTIFHRVIANFMIQGGGFNVDMQKRPTVDGVKNEWQNGLKNVRGSIAMARLGGQPDSGTNQFFINVKDNAALDVARDGAGYAVFGRVIAGMDVVDAIKVVPTGVVKGRRDVPLEPVVINEVTRMEPAEAHRFAMAERGEPSKGGQRK